MDDKKVLTYPKLSLFLSEIKKLFAQKTHTHTVVSSTANGFMPKLDGSTSHYMRGDGTWGTPPNTTYKQFTGATSTVNGTNGLVPAPVKGATSKFLKSDGTWSDVPKSTVNKSEIVNMIYPVGSLYMSTSSENPSTLFGGTWEAFGQGRTIIGKANEGTFSELESVGGAESRSISVAAHTHTIAHTHTVASHSHTIAHTHTVASHSHSIAHTHSIASHSHTIGNSAVASSQLGSHYHGIITPAAKGKLGVTSAGYAGTIYHGYAATNLWDEGQITIANNGGNGTHGHTCSGTGLTTGGSSAANSGGTALTTGGSSAANSGNASPKTGDPSAANSGSAGAQTISINITQPYIVVNIWKRTA